MTATETFDSLYHQLAHAWDSHQALRRQGADMASLSRSAGRLHQARLAMWDWHRHERIGGV